MKSALLLAALVLTVPTASAVGAQGAQVRLPSRPAIRQLDPRARSERDSQPVPTAYRPPPGMCRIWLDGVPASQQPAPTDCASAVRNRPNGGRVIFGDDYVEKRGKDKERARDRDKRPDGEEYAAIVVLDAPLDAPLGAPLDVLPFRSGPSADDDATMWSQPPARSRTDSTLSERRRVERGRQDAERRAAQRRRAPSPRRSSR